MKVPATIKAAAIADLIAGNTVAWVATRHDLPLGTVKSWKSREVRAVVDAEVAPEVAPRRPVLAEMLLELVENKIRGLVAITKVMQDPEWIKKQDAHQLADLFGVTHDKLVRILEAMDTKSKQQDQLGDGASTSPR